MPPLVTILAFLTDWLIGDPQTWPHPVRFIGKAIDWSEAAIRGALKRLQKERPWPFIIAGMIMYLLVAGLSAFVPWLLLRLAHAVSIVLWFAVAGYLVFAAVCLRDLLNHTAKVEERLRDGDLEGARKRLSWIVGRDTAPLDECAIRRAEIETLAENFSDGLVAPLFYLALGGPVLAWLYKATNTLDSMVGYKNDTYEFLGKFSARADDALNFLPSRLAALILIAASRLLGYDTRTSFSLWFREGNHHSRPNSGQTEAAMAGALGVFLGGTYSYQGVIFPKPRLYGEGRESDYGDVKAAEDMVKIGTVLALVLALAVETFIMIICGGASFLWGL